MMFDMRNYSVVDRALNYGRQGPWFEPRDCQSVRLTGLIAHECNLFYSCKFLAFTVKCITVNFVLKQSKITVHYGKVQNSELFPSFSRNPTVKLFKSIFIHFTYLFWKMQSIALIKSHKMDTRSTHSTLLNSK